MEVKVYVITLGSNRMVLRWQDPLTRRWKQKAAGTTNRREAERLAGKLQAELQEHRYVPPCRITWEEFRDRYEAEHLKSLAASSVGSACTALNHVEKHLRPHLLRHVNSDAISRLQAMLRETGIKETSIATHLRHLRAALSWAKGVGLLHEVPTFQMPKRAKGKSPMRGRPITAEEFERMLAVDNVYILAHKRKRQS